MFGNNNVQSSWANPAQNQQQQQQPGSAFGQPNTFGAGGAFGNAAGAFGQPQQQQPQANPMFGGLGTSTNSGTSAFGTFGQNAAQQPAANTSVFGAPKPASGFGAFGGGNSTFGAGGAFGASNSNTGTPGTGSSLFGNTSTPATNTSNSAFGGGMFGQNKPAAGFGTTTTTNQETSAPVTTGTSNPPYNAYSEKDSATSNIMLQYQTITAMPAYRGTSLEELRYQDYQQGRKTAGAFGQSSFGAPVSTTPATGLFGAAQTQPATNPLFGNNTFGGANATTNQTNPAGGVFGNFGQNAATNAQPSGTGTGLFGSTFGQTQQQQQQQQQQPSAFGAFGQPQQPQQQQQQPQQPAASGGIFGGGAFGQSKPASTFGTGTTFGAPATGGAFGATNTFGQAATQPAPTTGLFGQPQAQQQNAGTGAFGALGANTQAKPSIFGQPAQPAPATTSFGLFGNQQQQPQAQQPQSGGLFGSTGGSLFGQPQQNQSSQQQPQPQSGGLFGNTQTTQPSAGLFGSTSGGGLFGNTQQQNQAQQPTQNTSLFGPKPATTTTGSGGLFGGGFGQANNNSNAAGAAPQTGLFGQPAAQPATQQQNNATGGFGASLFGAPKPTAPGLAASNSTNGLGSSLFGNAFGQTNGFNSTTNPPGAQGSLTASIAEPIGSNLPIFSMLPPGPRAITLEQQPKKKPGFFVDVPTRSPVPRMQLGYTPANSKLRGFAASTSTSSFGGQPNPFAASMSLTSGKPNTLSLSRTDGRSSVGPESFLGRSSSPSLGSGGRQSVKKLILDKKVDPADLFSKSGGSPGLRSSPVRVTFSPALSQAAREKEVAREKDAASIPTPLRQSDSSNPPNRKAPNRFTAASTQNILGSDAESSGKDSSQNTASAPLQHGDYWVKPDLQVLRSTGYEELLAFNNLVVGRIGYGEIHFLAPVDLTGLPKLGALLGELVRFDEKECSVYPDSDEADKPPPGSGLNVAARIILIRCWATDKATREPIKDQNHPNAVKHLKKLKGMKNTHFEGFDIAEGKWTFKVDHF
ncbi:nucleoporin autopeptidase-domain-containing protein [Hygrophoropsis aurantiaca]|uniref:Nucleoporin autopeptidase-domain-containing protein n=1 Tax=Hygrophoropsis aurantiaca TaxID=72124 RepID=A0ACB8A7M1_9AGAM|nr:nucleoporin autopeptidase-domain-containing protein [Hygrophoropsis aurantiaca]